MFSIRQMALATTLTVSLAAPALAASYSFTVNYFGNNSAALAPGSDDPRTTSMHAGDSFVYTLQAAGNGEWSIVRSGSIWPLFALPVSEFGIRTSDSDYKIELSNNNSPFGLRIWTTEEEWYRPDTYAYQSLGFLSFYMDEGLVFDTLQLSYSIKSADTSSTASSLLPWPGVAPEFYSPRIVAFKANTVPEPSTYLLVTGGLCVAGLMARRRAAKDTP